MNVVYNGTIPISWKKFCDSHNLQIERVDQGDRDWEPGHQDYWVYLRPGWKRGYGEDIHMFHETRLRDIEEMWYQVKRCFCQGCQDLMKKQEAVNEEN